MSTNISCLHPRPQFERPSFESLDGIWDFCIDEDAKIEIPKEVSWNREIVVPFSPETEASGISDTGFYLAVWYRRQFASPALLKGQRLLLHFEAVDYRATIWLNGVEVGEHEGGFTPFTIDITHALTTDGPQELAVRAQDDPADLAKPRGKQDWKLDPHSIWYPRTTGIWQTVWLETVPTVRIGSLQWSSNLERWEIALDAIIDTPADRKLALHVCLRCDNQTLAGDTYEVICGEVHRRIALSDPGIDDYRNSLLWSPSSPTLIEAVVELRDEAGNLLDAVTSYTALRSVTVQGDRFVFNGRPLNLRMVLDQGYWPSSGLTPPSDEALKLDVLLAKRLGFNGVRKHQKVECARYLYWADKLGLLVWEEMPSAYRYTTQSIQRLTREWLQVIERDRSHPCIVAWVPFNESWGVPDLPESSAQRHYVQALYHLTKALDPTRLVIGNDGWESVATDIIGIHDYDAQPERIEKRYAFKEIKDHLFERERPGGRMLLLGDGRTCTHPIILTEFGGIAFASAIDAWGYSKTFTAEEFFAQYTALLTVVRSLPALAGFCYTQFADTYQEANGLLHGDRTPKISFEQITLATTGATPDHDVHTDALWLKHMMRQSG